MKFKKLTAVCAAVLVVGCLSTSAFAASAPVPLPSKDSTSITAVQTDVPIGYQTELLSAVTAAPNSDENVSTVTEQTPNSATAPTETPAAEEATESGGFMGWYMGLFNSPVFIIGFVAIIAVIALVLFKLDRSKMPGRKNTGKTNHRTDGL